MGIIDSCCKGGGQHSIGLHNNAHVHRINRQHLSYAQCKAGSTVTPTIIAPN